MGCIFCKIDALLSKSVEHIIPESLGNSKHTLPRGIVCDRCNNYFAVKVEKPLLDSEYFTRVRFRNAVPNKKGRIPPLENLYGPGGMSLGMYKTVEGQQGLYPMDDESGAKLVKCLETHDRGYFIVPEASAADPRLVARFLAKVGLEVLTHTVMVMPGWEREVVFRSELDVLRRFARFDQGRLWPFYERRIYREHHKFNDVNGEAVEVLHEFDTLYTQQGELYVVVAILGVEYAINLGGPEIDGYVRWLEEHGYRSPLYPDRDLQEFEAESTTL